MGFEVNHFSMNHFSIMMIYSLYFFSKQAGLDDMSSDLMAFRKARRLNPAASPASTSTASPPAFVSNLSTYSPWKAGNMRHHNIEVSQNYPALINFDQL